MFILVTCIICITYQIANLPYFQIGNQLTHTDHFSSFYTFDHNLSLPIEPFRNE
ncbi:Signal transducer and activator of transcription 2 [Gossypium arboreum]|uniref:Signal transducer and activator of transcription 2 n=1 Tax=Gossypium arboreum TaxID=29729 RepID=A0A0B0P8K9_GOSAR|nr:Signal transducer and activator of transcription 2 [Gossypium arboreum]